MSEQLEFDVVSITGNTSGLPAGILDTEEWISEENAVFPLTLVFRLQKRCHVEKICVLCHRYYIPSKMEVFSSDTPSAPIETPPPTSFTLLGEVSFKEKKSDVEKHELKTIFVDTVVSFVKFTIHGAYVNSDLNPSGRVGFLNVAFLGSVVEPSRRPPSGVGAARVKSSGGLRSSDGRASSSSRFLPPDAIESLSLGPKGNDYVGELTRLQASIEAQKAKAVEREDFRLAKKAQMASNQLALVVSNMSELAVAKKQAVEANDFDRAQEIQDEMRALRKSCLSKIDSRLLDDVPNDPRPSSRAPSSRSTSRPRGRRDAADQDSSNVKELISTAPPPSRSAISSPLRRRVGLSRDDRIVPALLSNPEPSDLSDTAEDALLLRVNDEDRSYTREAVKFFGADTITKLYSKRWEQRKLGFVQVKEFLAGSEKVAANPEGYLNVTMPALVKGLSDKLYNVYHEALGLLRFIVEVYLPSHGLVRKHATSVVQHTYGLLISRTGDTVNDSRFLPDTYNAVNEILHCDPKIAELYLKNFMRPFDHTGSTRSDQGKANFVLNAVMTLGMPNRQVGLTEQSLTPFAVLCMKHTDPEVRHIGRQLLLAEYGRGDQKVIQKSLPPVGAVSKYPTLKSVYRELGIDGRSRSVPRTADTRRVSTASSLSTTSGEDRRSLMTPATPLPSPSPAMAPMPMPEASPPGSKRRSVRLVVDDDEDAESADFDPVCMYCGKQDPAFHADRLIDHYETECPILTNCPSCRQPVEVRYMKKHLLDDCPQSERYRLCEKCQTPVDKVTYNKHRSSRFCKRAAKDSVAGRCMLCGNDVLPNNDLGWRTHLLDQCPGNARRRVSLSR